MPMDVIAIEGGIRITKTNWLSKLWKRMRTTCTCKCVINDEVIVDDRFSNVEDLIDYVVEMAAKRLVAESRV